MNKTVEWRVFIDDNDPEKIPFIVAWQNNQMRPLTNEEAERAVRILNEEATTVIRLLCQNPACSAKGSWIERARKDAEKNKYYCEVCHKAMER